MQMQFTARHFDASPELRDYAEQRLEKLHRYYDGITNASVTVTRGGNGIPEWTAEVAVRVYRQTLTARATEPTHEQAIDNCTERLRRQIMRYKAKIRTTSGYAHR